MQVNDTDAYDIAYAGVVETKGLQGITSCDYFPRGWVNITDILLEARSGPVSNPYWTPQTISNPSPDCSFRATGPTDSTVILFQNAPLVTSISTNPSPPTQGQSFSLTMNGSYFNPNQVQIVYAPIGCSQSNCQTVIPHSSLSGASYSQLTVSSLAIYSSGLFKFFAQNSANGPLSDSVTVSIPAPLSVAIDGPNPVPAHRYCTWDAMASGGTAPYAYSWTVNGNPAGDGSETLSITTPGSAFTIGVTATDANNLQAITSLSVRIGGSTCQY
jgi:hypothetical protein